MFLIPYFIFYMMFSLPTLIMEMLIGQVFRRGVIVTMERIHKFFSGLGKCKLQNFYTKSDLKTPKFYFRPASSVSNISTSNSNSYITAILFVTIIYNIYFNTTTAWTLYYSIKGIWQAAAPNSSYPGAGTCAEKGWTGNDLKCCQVRSVIVTSL